MKIAFVYPMFHPSVGGIEINMRNFGRALAEKGFNITVLTTDLVNGRSRKLPKVECIDGIQVRRFHVVPNYVFQRFAIAPSFIPYILTIPVDVIHIFSYLPYFFTVIAWLITKIRGIDIVFTPTYHPDRKVIYKGVLRFLMPIFDTLGQFMLRKSRIVLGLTDGETEYYLNRGIKARTLPPALGLNSQCYEESENENFRRRFNLNTNVLLYVGRLEKKKGVHHLIGSFPKVIKRIPQTSLLIVGRKSGNYENLKGLSIQLGCSSSVVFTGYLSNKDLCYAYSVADIVILPSEFETFGHTILESWAYKKAVISINTGGPRELVTSDTGLLTEYGNEDELADSIIYLLENNELRHRMGETGYYKLYKWYDYELVVHKLASIYREIVNKN